MASEEPGMYKVDVDQRPTWPYELWTIVTMYDDNTEECIINTEQEEGTLKEESNEKLSHISHKEESKSLTSAMQEADSNLVQGLKTCTLTEVLTDETTETEKKLNGKTNDINSHMPTGKLHGDQNIPIKTSPSVTGTAEHGFEVKADIKETNEEIREMSERDSKENELMAAVPDVKVEDQNEDNKDESVAQDDRDDDGIEEEQVVYEPDHWTDEMETDIPSSCPINTLVEAVASPDISQTEEAKQMKADLMPMLESTLKELTLVYKVFQDSYLMPVGSMAEHSKVGKADEFDFAVILPVLAKAEYFELLNKRNDPVTDSTIMSLISDIWEGNIYAAANSFQQGLRDLWSDKMMKYVPDDWTVLNPSGHSDTHSVAATFHLEKKSDHTQVDMDVCFWVPLNKESLFRFKTSQLPQKYYLTEHCLDENGFAYAIVPHDSNVCLAINTVRFAMSRVERAALLKYGPENYRLICYRVCKSLVSALVPKVRKNDDCTHCFDSLISSFCLKNVVLYMASYHKEEAYWTKEKLPNRVLEVFTILSFCMKVNCCQVSAYFTPYQLSVDFTLRYQPSTQCVTESNWYETREISCTLPNLTPVKQLFSNDPFSFKAVEDYEEFLTKSSWRYPEVICRLAELLTNLAQTDEEDRRELTEDIGWNLIGLSLPEAESYVQSIGTRL